MARLAEGQQKWKKRVKGGSAEYACPAGHVIATSIDKLANRVDKYTYTVTLSCIRAPK